MFSLGFIQKFSFELLFFQNKLPKSHKRIFMPKNHKAAIQSFFMMVKLFLLPFYWRFNKHCLTWLAAELPPLEMLVCSLPVYTQRWKWVSNRTLIFSVQVVNKKLTMLQNFSIPITLNTDIRQVKHLKY